MHDGTMKESKSQINQQIDGFDRNLEKFEDTIKTLEVRLEIILRSPEPREEKDRNVNVLVPLASELENRNSRFGELINELQDVIERIEL